MLETISLKTRWIYLVIFLKGFGLSVLAIFLFYIGLNVVAPRKVVPVFGFQHFVISSTSMEPDLLFGDVVVIEKVKPEDLKVGDIITYYAYVDPADTSMRRVTHYLAELRVTEDGTIYKTRRADTNVLDSWEVQEEDILGRYMGHFNGLGKITLFMTHPLGVRIIVINVVIISLILFVIYSKKFELNTEDEEKTKNK